MLKTLIIASTLSFNAAVPAPAQERNSGVGPLIAEQGNQALRVIQAEFKEAVRTWAPALPAHVARRVVRLAGVPAVTEHVRSAS